MTRQERTEWSRGSVSAILGICASILSASCSEETERGVRAAEDGMCPRGEICSEKTPKGLVFHGSHLFFGGPGGPLPRTALFGTQTISALHGDAPGVPYVAGFDATILDENIAKIDVTRRNSIVVRGVSEGKTVLRFLEPGTNSLLDRIEIRVAPVMEAMLVPLEIELEMESSYPNPPTWALWASSRPLVGVVLMGEDGGERVGPLVDETLEVSSLGAEVRRRSWDLYEVAAPRSGEVSFAMRAGSRVFFADTRVTASIDAIVPTPSSKAPEYPDTVDVGALVPRCFAARSGSDFVVGAKWKFEPSEGIEITSGEDSPLRKLPNCTTIRGTKAGPAKLSVTAGNYSASFDFVVE